MLVGVNEGRVAVAHNLTIKNSLITLKAAYLSGPYPSHEARQRQLNRLRLAIIENKSRLIGAAKTDFSVRSEHDTVLADVIPTISHINYLSKHLREWMKPEKRSSGLEFFPSKVLSEYVPKGVVGIIAPWNYPIQLALVPLATAIAAGNKVMIKLSEYTPAVNAVIKDVLAVLKGDCVVIEGGPDVATEFSHQAFDHLFFTGSTEVGKKVYTAAAQNLVPVTLELGGKSPLIVLEDANIEKVLLDIVFAKNMNAGQVCVAPDYVLVHEAIYDEFIKKLKLQFLKSNTRALKTGILNEAHAQRLKNLMVDAQDRGAKIYHSVELESIHSKEFGTHMVIDPPLDARIMQEEVFGPVLNIIKVQSIAHAKMTVQELGTPLACYLYTNCQIAQNDIRQNLQSGALCINDMLFHVAVPDLPFGGVGSSGFGNYHGKEGFVTFSHCKSIFQSSNNIWRSKLFSKYSHVIQRILTRLYLR
ncbi:aldehyde dehydrogenase family protein [Pseudoalteromonas luteoviolacea]|uniref:aldehyde dehydrogenase family protein n=1 Tax=Pseudoalteromonas luteoviolacea TaxID=43657 RepID=UPI001B387D34|nr:aldehyde dehydrogenase family protein [Pseudoalteromonas luteoviolacea]MBQ4875822.1 aldehyde dehydrogenase family protein [Pseudoalteromonas luteoviolacea]MBQ4904857.1 aldehyde dehydrogenase family protein [Pseudoalteromonas luteoviolacea]